MRYLGVMCAASTVVILGCTADGRQDRAGGWAAGKQQRITMSSVRQELGDPDLINGFGIGYQDWTYCARGIVIGFDEKGLLRKLKAVRETQMPSSHPAEDRCCH